MPPRLTGGTVQKVRWSRDPGTYSSALQSISQCSVGDLWLPLGESEKKKKKDKKLETSWNLIRKFIFMDAEIRLCIVHQYMKFGFREISLKKTNSSLSLVSGEKQVPLIQDKRKYFEIIIKLFCIIK